MSPSALAPSHLPIHLIGFSTKTYLTLPQTTSYISTLLSSLPLSPRIQSSPLIKSQNLTLFILPSFPFLYPAQTLLADLSNPRIWLGAQNTHTHHGSPPLTGEVSPLMLKEVGCRIVCLGHAERRRAGGSGQGGAGGQDGQEGQEGKGYDTLKSIHETTPLIALKAQGVVDAGMTPLVCIGETTPPSPSPEGETVERAARECFAQVSPALAAVWRDTAGRGGSSGGEQEQASLPGIIFAYEPVWAIGATEPASAEHVCGVVGKLRGWVRERYGEGGGAGETRWLYGGSAGPGVWEKLRSAKGRVEGEGRAQGTEDGNGGVEGGSGGVDGLFLGRFAHDVGNFVRVVEEVVQCEKGMVRE